MFKNAFALLQKMGKALMLPVSVLPIAGLLLGLGSARLIELQQIKDGVINSPRFWFIPEQLAQIMRASGDAVFANLPIIFAIAVAIGYTDNDGVSAVAAIVGFAIFLASMGMAAVHLFGVPPFVNCDANSLNAVAQNLNLPPDGVINACPESSLKLVLGIPTLDTGVFGGLIVGCLAAYLFLKFFRIQLPQYLGFFAGKRSVPILTGLACILLGIAMAVIWPPIGNVINSAANAAADGGNVPLTAFIYGFVERLLLPFGLHHIWNVPFFFQIGSFTNPVTGEIVRGDIARFFAGDQTAGILGGAYWFKMFGLPAAAIAIWHSAKPKNRKVTGGIMLSAAFTSFLTGITEPIEFSFMFVAPALYGIHALMAGFADWLFATLGGRMGFTFSQGGIDFLLFNSLGTKTWLIPAGAPFFAALYYFTFKYAIKYFDFKTPGREDEDTATVGIEEGDYGMSKALVRAFGGRHNIASIDACITRLRMTVNDINKVNVDRLKALGASGVLTVGNSAQAIFGPRSENLKTDMVEYLKVAGPEADVADLPTTPTATAEVAATKIEAKPLKAEEIAHIREMINALGGKSNIRKVDSAAITRLRLEVGDQELVDEDALRTAGVKGIMPLSDSVVHLLIGLNAEQYEKEMKTQLGST